MKKTSNKIEEVTKRVVNRMVDIELYGWPPQCATFYYQPVRPMKTQDLEQPNLAKVRLQEEAV